MFNIISHYGNSSQNHWHLTGWLQYKTLKLSGDTTETLTPCSLTPFWLKCKIVFPLYKTIWPFLKKLNRVTKCPRNFTPSYIPKDTKNRHSHKNLYMSVHISIIKNRKKKEKQRVCSSTNKWLNKMKYYPYKGILFIHTRNEMIRATTWANLENIMLSGRG